MKNSAKSLMAALLTVIMVLSSFAIFAISGGAVTEVTVSKIEEYKVEKLDNGYVLDTLNGSSVTWQDLIDYEANPVEQRFGLSFTAEAAVGDVAYELRLRASNSANTKWYTSILKFKADGNIVVGLEESTVLATYTAGQPVRIYVDIYAKWPSAEANATGSKLIVDYYIDGAHVYTFEKDNVIGLPTNFGYVQFSGNATTAESKQLKVTDIKAYDPTKLPSSSNAATEVTVSKIEEYKVEKLNNGYVLDAANGSSVTWQDLIDYQANPVEQRFGLSFTAEAAAGNLAYELRLRASNSVNTKWYTSILKFKDTGDIVVGLEESTVLAKYTAGQPVDICLDIYAKWPSAEANTAGSKLIVDYYIDGVYVYTFEQERTIGLPTNFGYVQFSGSATTAESNKMTITDIKAYDTTNASCCGSFIYTGASMRLMDDAASSGLRFTYGVDKAWFDSLEGATVGALIIPTDKLPNGFSESAFISLKAEDYIELTDIGFKTDAEEADSNTYVYYASLIDLREANYARSFTGVGFVEVNGERIYTGAQTRSIYEVASNYTASGKVPAENKTLVDRYLSKVVSLETVDGIPQMVTVANYDSPYTLTESSITSFTISGEVDNIKAIILNGEVYTDGWSISEGVLSVTAGAE